MKTQRGIFEKKLGSNVWWIRYVDAHGQYRREVAGTKSNAISLLHNRKNGALEGRKLPANLRKRPVSFSDLGETANLYIEQTYFRPAPDVARMRVLMAKFTGAAESITVSQAKNTLATLAREHGWSNHTLNHYHNLLSLSFRLGIEADLIRENPARGFQRKQGTRRVRFLSADEETRLRETLRKNPAWASHEVDLDLALNCGLRHGDMYRRLIWDNVNLADRTATIPRSKNGDPIVVPLNTAALQALAVYRTRGDGTGRVVRGVTGAPLNFSRFWFAPALKAAQISNFCWHDIRHTYASRLLQAGVPLASIAQLLEHRQLEMTRRYAHLANNHLHDAVAKLAANSTPVAPSETEAPVLSGYVQ